jgi:hypothetical protein
MTMQIANNSNETTNHNHNFSHLLVNTAESQDVDDEILVSSMGLLFIWVSQGMIA